MTDMPNGGDTEAGERLDRPPVQTSTIEADVAEPTTAVARRAGTFESFRHRDFTWFWLGSLVSNTGTWMQTAALALVVWGLRGRELDLGLVNFAAGIPVLFLALPAGALADRVDKRTLLMWSQLLLGFQAAALWLLHSTGRLSAVHALEALIWIAFLGVIGGILSALTFPAWQAFLPDLVERRTLMNAIALNSAQFQGSRMLGPIAAGTLMAAGISTGDIFLVNATSYLFVIAALWAIRPKRAGASHGLAEDDVPPVARHKLTEKDIPPRAASGMNAAWRAGAWRNLTAGLSYAREDQVVGMLILSTAFMTVFAMPYMMLLPAIAEKSLGGGDLEYSWLLAANGFGAVFGSLGVASLKPAVHREKLIPVSILVMAGLLSAFALSRSLWLSLVLSVLAGAAFLTTNSLTNTSIQASVPSELRGRVMALFVMSFMGIMPVSSALFGPIGEWVGPGNAVLGGAVVLAGWGLYLVRGRKLTRLGSIRETREGLESVPASQE